MGCHAERAKQPSPFPSLLLPWGSPQIAGRLRSLASREVGKQTALPQSQLHFLPPPRPAGLSAGCERWAVAQPGRDVQGRHFSLAPGILSLCPYEETRAFTFSFWPMWGRLDFWKLFLFFFFPIIQAATQWIKRLEKRLWTFFVVFNGSDEASNQRARQRHAFSLPVINSPTQTLHHVEGRVINKHGYYQVTILRMIYINCLLSSD